MTESADHRNYGPVFTTREDLFGRAATGRVLETWHAFPRIDGLPIADIGALRARMEQLPARGADALKGSFVSAATGLPAILAAAERSLIASRTGVLLLLVQLAVLAGYAIALTADLIVDHRRVDTALLRSRGASTTQVAILAMAEAALLAVPAVLVGPWLAAQALRLFNVAGPLTQIGLAIEPSVTTDAVLAAAGAAVGCSALLVLPAVLAARSYAAETSTRTRPGTRPLGQRLGLDIALLAVTAIGLYQLRLYGSPLTTTIQGSLGADPLLVAAPAIGILAGSVVALRIVPLLAAVADTLTARGRDLVSSLGAKQLARRPLRYTRTALLLILAMSMGVFSVSYGSTWTGSQLDQANFAVGADARVTPARGVEAMPAWAVEAAYRSIRGVTAMMPVSRERIQVTRSSLNGELLGVEPAALPRVLAIRDGSADGLVQGAAALVAADHTPSGIPLPGIPRRVAITAAIKFGTATTFVFDPVTGEARPDPVDPAEFVAGSTVIPEVTIRDGRGTIHRFNGAETSIGGGEAGPADAASGDAASQVLVVGLTPNSAARIATTERLGGALTGPLEIVGVELTIHTPSGTQLGQGSVGVASMATSDVADGDAWQPLDLSQTGTWSLRWAAPAEEPQTIAVSSSAIAIDLGNAGVVLQGVNGTRGGATVSFLQRSIAELATAVLPAVVNRRLAEAAAAEPGDTVILQLPGGQRRFKIAAVVDAIPATDPTRPMALVNLAALSLSKFAADRSTQNVTEWWLDLDDPDEVAGPAAAAVEAARIGGPLEAAAVVTRLGTWKRLATDPIALATIGALSIGFVVAGLFAVIGLAVSASVSARQRRTEFALLRALGLSPDQLSGWLWLENASLVVVSILAGTGLGLLIGWVVLPFITVTRSGGVPFPPVVVEVPWASIAVLEAISIAALAITLVVLSRSMRRAGVGSVLRMGED